MDRKELIRYIIEQNLCGKKCKHSRVFNPTGNNVTEVKDEDQINHNSVALCTLVNEIQKDKSVVCPWLLQDRFYINGVSGIRCGNYFALLISRRNKDNYEKYILPFLKRYLEK